MKNSKSVLLLAVVAAVLILGIAYAAVTSNLTITATATTAPEGSNFKVAFTGTTAVASELADQTTSTDTLVTISAEGQTASLTISEGVLKTVGDSVTGTFTIKNSSVDLTANMVPSITNSNDEYFEVTHNLASASLAPDAETTITVTVKLIKTPLANVTTTATATIVATAAEA